MSFYAVALRFPFTGNIPLEELKWPAQSLNLNSIKQLFLSNLSPDVPLGQ